MTDSLPEYIRNQYQSIWMQTPDGLLHDNNTFGHLTVRIAHHSSFCIQYEDNQFTLCPESGQISLKPAVPQMLPDFYLYERIGCPFLRLLSGYVLLHCGAVSSSDGCVGLLALPGVGKSTLSAALLAASTGFCLAADDVLPLFCDDHNVYAVPSSSHLAMRHSLFNDAPFVESIDTIKFKKALRIQPSRLLHAPTQLKSLIILHAANASGTPHPVLDKSCVIPDLLTQQMTISHPPKAFSKAQFAAMMQIIRRVPVLEADVCLRTPKDIEQTVAQFLQVM